MFDLSNLNTKHGANTGTDMVLRHPVTSAPLFTGGKHTTKTEWKVKVVGHDSDLFQQAQTERSRDMQELRDRGGEANMNEVRRLTCRMIARCILGWENITNKGEKVEFNFENAVDLLQEYPWIREQIDAFIVNRGNFLA